MDTKVRIIITREPCVNHGVMRGIACWTVPALRDGGKAALGVCMHRAAKTGILTPKAKRQFLGIK